MHKPTISMQQVDKSEFINTRTFWVVSDTTPGRTLDLQVKHQYPVDGFTVMRWEDGISERLVPIAEYQGHVDALIENEGATVAEAEAQLANLVTPIRAMTSTEAEDVAELRRWWESFVLLFNPQINSF